MSRAVPPRKKTTCGRRFSSSFSVVGVFALLFVFDHREHSEGERLMNFLWQQTEVAAARPRHLINERKDQKVREGGKLLPNPLTFDFKFEDCLVSWKRLKNLNQYNDLIAYELIEGVSIAVKVLFLWSISEGTRSGTTINERVSQASNKAFG